MIVIFLYGKYAKKFGKRFELFVDSLPAAIRLLEANFPGKFQKLFKQDSFHVCRGELGKHTNVEDINFLQLSASKGTEFHLIPKAVGAGSAMRRKGLGALLLGALILGVSFFFGFTPGIYAGLSLILGGASLLLTPEIGAKNEDKQTSYSFNGPLNIMREGATKPVIYGKALVGSVVGGGSISSVNSPATGT